MAEKPELFGRGLILMVLPETIVVFGLVIALQLLAKVAP
jgi:V/A-type H+-transporting ATPase subunit K